MLELSPSDSIIKAYLSDLQRLKGEQRDPKVRRARMVPPYVSASLDKKKDGLRP